jgi:hypothetical protein
MWHSTWPVAVHFGAAIICALIAPFFTWRLGIPWYMGMLLGLFAGYAITAMAPTVMRIIMLGVVVYALYRANRVTEHLSLRDFFHQPAQTYETRSK